jgi:4-amino-4-deoxy-L-arabinose transferase-like glycosyltransferase
MLPVMILGVCMLARGGAVLTVFATNPRVATQGDTRSYVMPALALLHYGRFSRSPRDPEPEFVRTPGYPAFIAAISGIFGEHEAALLLAQVVLSSLTILVVYWLGTRMWSVGVGLLAAAMTLIEPLQLFSTGTISSESLATLLVTLVAAAGFVLFSQARPKVRWPLLLGVAIAAATMVRPVTYYLPLLVVGILAYIALRRGMSYRRGLKVLAVFLVPFLVVIGGWQLRNREAVGSWRFSEVEAKNLYLTRSDVTTNPRIARPVRTRRTSGVTDDGTRDRSTSSAAWQVVVPRRIPRCARSSRQPGRRQWPVSAAR